MVHYLLQRKLKTSKTQEIWFAVGGKPIRFSLKEFALTSGLKTGRRPSELELERVTKDERLKDELFGVGARVTLDQLKEKFLSMDLEARSKKQARIAFVYLLA